MFNINFSYKTVLIYLFTLGFSLKFKVYNTSRIICINVAFTKEPYEKLSSDKIAEKKLTAFD